MPIFIKASSLFQNMNSRHFFLAVIFCCLLAACGTMQSIVLSSMPYTTSLTLPASSKTGESQTATGTATSLDKIIFKNGGNINRVNAVKVVSAEVRSALPADFDLGQLASLRIYMQKADGSDAVLVASKEKLPADAGNVIALDINNSGFLDRFIRESDIRIKMIYTLRSKVTTDVNVMLMMNFNATPIR